MRHSTRTEVRDGWVWPAYDTKCFPYSFHDEKDIPDWVLSHVPGRRTVVQAGGNCGQYVRPYAVHFERVVTFEPDPLNLHCLVQNADLPNVYAIGALLGDAGGDMPMAHDIANCGAHYVWTKPIPEGAKGPSLMVPSVPLDAFRLDGVDLIHLDIEGYELHALNGATRTIERCRPWIALEARPEHMERMDAAPGRVAGFMYVYGYELAASHRHEQLYRPMR